MSELTSRLGAKLTANLAPSLLQQINDDVAVISERVLDSLVQIHNGQRGVGAGAIWQSDGLIITNAHVIMGQRGQLPNTISVTLRNGEDYPARLIAHDAQHDLAALRINAADLSPIERGNSRHLNAGDIVLAMGFPWGVKGGATSGVVIGSGAQLPEIGDNKREWIAASLHLRPGHSGGPLVDSLGRLVGISTLMNGPEVGVAIPVHVVEAFLTRALTTHSPTIPSPMVRV